MTNKRNSLRLVLFTVMFSVITVQADATTPLRIITLSPHLAELVTLIGAGEQLSGVVEHSDYPQTVREIQRIGGASGLDLERILTIKPDLVLAWQGGTRESDISSLKRLGFRVVSLKSESLEDIPDSINALGNLLNRSEQATKLIEKFNQHRDRISEKYGNLPAYRYFIEISSQPLMALSNRHSFGAGLGLCNLQNIFSDEDKAAIIIDLESVLSRKPEYVLLRSSVADNEQKLAARLLFYRIRKGGPVKGVRFDEDAAFRQTPRLLDAVEQVCRNVHESRLTP